MSVSSFDSTFQRLTNRLLTVGSLSGIAWGFCGSLLLLSAGFWIDLVWELSSVARVIAVVTSATAGIVLLVVFLTVAIRSAAQVLMVRRLDQTAETGGEIVTGYELQSSSITGLSQGLAQIAVSRSALLASQIPTSRVVPDTPARQGAIAATAIVAGMLFAAVVAPVLTQTEWLRFADPFGDHPPYSRTHFHVEPGDTSVRYGDGLEILVTVTGQPIDDLELVLRTSPDGRKTHDERLPMFFDVAGQWKASVSSITSPVQYFVQARTGRSRRFKISVATVPQIENVRFRIQPPDYTRDAVYEGPLPQGGINALAGTIIEVKATSNRPLKEGLVEVVGGERRESVSLKPATSDEECREVRGQWTVTQAGSFHLSVTDIAGQKSRDSFSGTMNLLRDQTPMVRIVEPATQSLATPSVTLPVSISAEDDYGITRLQLFRSLNDSRATPMSFDLPSPPSRRLEQPVQLPLSAYGLQPGDVIKLFARVEDNDPAGAKGSESSVVVIQIISEQDLERLVRAREGLDVMISKYQEAQRRLEAAQEEIDQMRKKLEKRDPDGALSEEEKQELEKLAERLADQANAVSESAKHLMPYDLDKSLNDELKQLSKKLQDASDAAANAANSLPKAGQAARQLAAMQETLAREKKQMKEGVTDPLEQLSEIYPLLEDQNRFVELYYRQRDLAERLNSLKNQNNPDDPSIKARMRELEAEQRKTREDLENLLNDIETHAQRLPEDDERLQELAQSALEFVESVRGSGAETSMSNAELKLAEFSGEKGHSHAKSAADILEKFLSRCQGNGQACDKACQSLKFSPGEGALGDTLSQLLADAGFNPGMGMKPGQGRGGVGSGGGYSARRGEMSQIGLYGNLPTRGNPTSAKGGGKRGAKTIGGSYTTDSNNVTSTRLDPHGLLKSSGTSETAIPARYRGRVQDYFQRIAEEAGSQKQSASGPDRRGTK